MSYLSFKTYSKIKINIIINYTIKMYSTQLILLEAGYSGFTIQLYNNYCLML